MSPDFLGGTRSEQVFEHTSITLLPMSHFCSLGLKFPQYLTILFSQRYKAIHLRICIWGTEGKHSAVESRYLLFE